RSRNCRICLGGSFVLRSIRFTIRSTRRTGPGVRPRPALARGHPAPDTEVPMAQVIAPEIDAFLQAVAAQVHADADNFVGRKDILGAGSPDAPGVAQQFLDVHNRMLVLVGPPDIGKTALIARLARDYEDEARQQPYLAHFCGLNDGDNPYL